MAKKYYQDADWKIRAQMDLPFLPTPPEVIEGIFRDINAIFPLKGKKLIDLGAGDGRVIIYAAKTYQMHAIGIEISSNFLQGMKEKIAKEKLGHLCKVQEMDMYQAPISKYDVMFYFDFPPNHKYLIKSLNQAQLGTFFVSVRWEYHDLAKIFGWEEVAKITDNAGFLAFIYRKKNGNP